MAYHSTTSILTCGASKFWHRLKTTPLTPNSLPLSCWPGRDRASVSAERYQQRQRGHQQRQRGPDYPLGKLMPEGSSAAEADEQCTVLITEERVGQEGCFNWKGGRCSGRGGWNVITPPPSDAWSISLHRTQPSTNKPKLRAGDWFLQLSRRSENLSLFSSDRIFGLTSGVC